jgi:hypothetical protein
VEDFNPGCSTAAGVLDRGRESLESHFLKSRGERAIVLALLLFNRSDAVR